MTALTTAQRAALRYVAAVNVTGVEITATPRRDVLQRLAGLGLITREVTASRTRSQDRWRFDARHTLTDAGRAAL
jgi:hypothetical protein